MAPVAWLAIVASALVCTSLQPDHMTTSAGEVLVSTVFLYAESPLNADLARPKMDVATPLISPLAYDMTADSKPSPASLARLGSLRTPLVE